MLTRLKVSGFKNLVDVDVRFGAFTCVAGANATGKSNLFDAIQFLSALADKTLLEAALSVRGKTGRAADVRNLFHRVGDQYAEEMHFEAEMIIPRQGEDDLGQIAQASTTFVRYQIALAYRENDTPLRGHLELLYEKLNYIKLSEASKHLPFTPKAQTWRKSVLHGRRTSSFIDTEMGEADQPVRIKLSQDQVSGRPKIVLASNLLRTVLSTTAASESPTAFLTRYEMRSWRLLQLEPAALRQPDEFRVTAKPPSLQTNGQHLPATLDYLAHEYVPRDDNYSDSWAYEQVASRLAELIDHVYQIVVNRDEQRELLTVEVRGKNGTMLPARSLSDGTLRFLALSVLELDPRVQGLICLEEPENGIHPQRIVAMLRLLQDLAVDLEEEVDFSNPQRQIIINTHSPTVVQEVPDDSLLIAAEREEMREGQRFNSARFGWLDDTWRAKANQEMRPIPKGELMAYLQPVLTEEETTADQEEETTKDKAKKRKRRVVDRPDLQPYLPFGESKPNAP